MHEHNIIIIIIRYLDRDHDKRNYLSLFFHAYYSNYVN